MWEYGCCLCQKWHREDEAVYRDHIMFQSKNGPRFVPVEQAIIEAAAVAQFRCEKPAGEVEAK